MTVSTKTALGAQTHVHDWLVDVNTGTYDTPVWTPLGAMYNIKPILKASVKDDSDFDSSWGSDGISLLKWGIEAKCWRRRKVATPSENDAGQEALRAYGALTLGGNVADIRYFKNTASGPQTEAYRGYVAVQWEPDGGATEDYDSVTITMLGRGDRTPITHPAAAASVPTVASILPAAGAAAGGEAAVIKGQFFTGVTAVKIGSTSVTDYQLVDDFTLAIVTPAKVAGTYEVFVTNATGTNATGPAFVYS